MVKATELALALLATKLGTSIEALWPHVVGYVQMQAVAAIIAGWLAAMFMYALGWRFVRVPDDVRDSEESHFGGYVLWAAGTIVGALVTIYSLPVIFYPEARAIQYLVSLIH